MMEPGQIESLSRTFAQADFDRFAALSGDDNPIHVDPEFSARSRFGRTVAHGMLLYSVVCGLLGSRLPGPGTLQVEQELMFPSPTFCGEEVRAQIEVRQVRAREGLADLGTTILRPDGSAGLQGRTLVRLPGSSIRPFANLPGGTGGSQPPADLATGQAAPAFKGFALGQRAEVRRAFEPADLDEYADLIGDTNPLFGDERYTRRLGLEGRIVPGGLLGGLFSYLLGTELPGRGTNYLKQKLEFPAPAYAGQDLAAVVEITRLRPEKQLVNLNTICTGPGGQIVCRGEALVLIGDVSARE